MLTGELAVLWCFVLTAVAGADDAPPGPGPNPPLASDGAIDAILAPIREKHQVPGLIVGVVKPQGLTAAGVVGIRKEGSPEVMTVSDKLHLGSNTKAMTATRIAMLVDEGKLSWQSTVGDVFADLKAGFHEDFLGVTLEQLLTHRAGLPANIPYHEINGDSRIVEREEVVKQVFSRPPEHPPGTKFLYSNVGYIAAGHIAERVTGKSWEELMTTGLFEALQMPSAGFGFPGTKGQVDQPWGHGSFLGKPMPQQLDNAAVIGPAGTVHCTLADWAKFVAFHLHPPRGDKLLKPETFERLHTPPAGGDYAMGWIVTERPWAGGRVLAHSGSNTMWYATVFIAPKRDVAFLAVTNIGGTAGQQACDEALSALIKHELQLP
jgi:CubicO group peptidase (beta-lactamase class C family)